MFVFIFGFLGLFQRTRGYKKELAMLSLEEMALGFVIFFHSKCTQGEPSGLRMSFASVLTTLYLFMPSPLFYPSYLLSPSNWAFSQIIWTEERKAKSSSRRKEFSASSLIVKRLEPIKETNSKWISICVCM